MKTIIWSTLVPYLTCLTVTLVMGLGLLEAVKTRPIRTGKVASHHVVRAEYVTATPVAQPVPSVMAQLDAADLTWSYLDAQEAR